MLLFLQMEIIGNKGTEKLKKSLMDTDDILKMNTVLLIYFITV